MNTKGQTICQKIGINELQHSLWHHDTETPPKLFVLREGKQPMKGGFSLQRASKAELSFCYVISLNKLLNKQNQVISDLKCYDTHMMSLLCAKSTNREVKKAMANEKKSVINC